MTITAKGDSDACSVCAHIPPANGACPHPWHLPFHDWPAQLLRQLHEIAPAGWDPI